MVNRIIADYLKAGKRLVIPQFGAFIHKDTDGGVVFVPFLKKDDGVLATQLSTTYGLSSEEAYGVITEYIAQVQRSVTDRGSFVVEGVGRLRIDSNGVCYLETDNRAGDTQPQNASMPKPVVQTPAQPSARAVGTGTRCYCTKPCGAKCLSPTCANPTGPGPMSAAGTAASCLTGPSAVPAVSTAPAPTTPSGYARAASCSALGQYPAPSGRLPAARSAGRASATGMSAVSGPAGATSATGTVPCAASGATNLRRSSAVCPARRWETCVSASGRGWNAGSAKRNR